MEITIDKQNLSPRIKKTGTLVYSELTNTLFIKSKNKGVMQIGSSVDTSNFVEKSTTIEINGVAQDLSTSRTWTIFVPTKTSELTNDSGFLTSSDLSSYLTISSASATYQPLLVSGTSIKTINGTSLLGSGDISVSSSPILTTGSIPFSNGSTLIENNSNLFWDNTNKRLGIGTSTPSTQVHIKGAAGNNLLLLESPDSNPMIRVRTLTTSVNRRPCIAFTNPNTEWAVGFNTSDGKFRIAQGGDLGTDATCALAINKTTYNFGIRVLNPTATLHIRAGTTSAGSAPLKFTSGTNLTTPEAGTVEYNNTFHLTNSDNIRRYIVLAPNTTKVTTGAPNTNDGYVIVNIGGIDFKLMTCL